MASCRNQYNPSTLQPLATKNSFGGPFSGLRATIQAHKLGRVLKESYEDDQEAWGEKRSYGDMLKTPAMLSLDEVELAGSFQNMNEKNVADNEGD